jgi:hypothetical protein
MKRTRLPRISPKTAHEASASRAGVTLTEVLISLLVMSVAVVSVATLFPLSILRSVRARQLTQATILKYNAQNQLDLHPGLANGLPSHAPAVIDPLGWHRINELGLELQDNFGNDGSDPPNAFNFLERINGDTFDNLPAARKLVSLPDTWINVTEGVANSNTRTEVIPADFDLRDLSTVSLNDGEYRVTLFDPTERFSHVRTLTPDSTATVIRCNPDLPLPNGFIVGRVRIELLEQRYTWLLTVRPSVRSADVVVFFRRSFSPEDERIYLDTNNSNTFFNPISPGLDGQPGVAGNDDNNNNQTDEAAELGWPNTDDHPNRQILITWNPDDEPPFMRRNGFVFDVQNALWYRIHQLDIDEVNGLAVLTLDQDIKAKGRRGAILMRGIVDVYPISF